MTTGPTDPQPDETQPYGFSGAVPPPPASTPPPPPPPPTGGYPGYQGYQPPGLPAGAYGVSSSAPYGLHPGTGIPYSDKSKLVAGLLQILIPFGVGRFYMGFTGIGVAQLLVAFFTCGLWSIIDGIIILVKDDAKDSRGYILRS